MDDTSELLRHFCIILDEKVGFIGPFILKQQLKEVKEDGFEQNPMEYPQKLLQLTTLISVAVEALFGKKKANEVFMELNKHVPKPGNEDIDYPRLYPK